MLGVPWVLYRSINNCTRCVKRSMRRHTTQALGSLDVTDSETRIHRSKKDSWLTEHPWLARKLILKRYTVRTGIRVREVKTAPNGIPSWTVAPSVSQTRDSQCLQHSNLQKELLGASSLRYLYYNRVSDSGPGN